MPAKKDLTNKIFGLVRCVSPAPSKNKKTYWNCECIKCGANKKIQTTHLTGGLIKSCGCGCLYSEKAEQSVVFSSKEKKCEICQKDFKVIRFGESRKFCFECVPANLSFSERTKVKRQAIKNEGVKRLGGECKKCGEKRSYVLSFHHLDPNAKEDTPSRMIANSSYEEFFKEIKKCILLCNNCHSEFHYLEANKGITIEDYLNE